MSNRRTSSCSTLRLKLWLRIELLRAAVTCRGFSQNYTAAALAIFGFGFETTNRKEGRRRLGLTARTSGPLKALRGMVATLPLW